MNSVLQPWQLLVAILAGWVNHRQQAAIEYQAIHGSSRARVSQPGRREADRHMLHYPEEVRACPAAPAGPPATPEEARLADVLLDAASGPLEWTAYRDERAEELRALIEAKIAGLPPATEPAGVLPLLEALKRSVAAAQAPTNGVPAPLAKVRRKRGRRTA